MSPTEDQSLAGSQEDIASVHSLLSDLQHFVFLINPNINANNNLVLFIPKKSDVFVHAPLYSFQFLEVPLYMNVVII